jgi:phage N-6-adenine-methyltransferase
MTNVNTTWHEVTTSTGNVDWSTPDWLFNQLSDEFGPFTLDVAASHENHKCARYFTIEDDVLDGLSQPWYAKAAFCNPPYGRTISTWIAKAVSEVSVGNAALVVALLPVRADTAWWRTATSAASLIRIWPARLRFGEGGTAPFASVVMVFGRLTGRHGTEPAWCPGCGRVHWPVRSSHLYCSNTCQKRVRRAELSAED